MVLEAFMESYGHNVAINGSSTDIAAFFEGVTPCSYEDAIETFFEAQLSVQAMSIMTENAIMMESSGVEGVVSENVVGDFFRAAWEKIKEVATKVKEFAIAIIKKIGEFFHQLYMKNSPIDKVMQLGKDKVVSYSDITQAVANGYKIPGTLNILTKDAENAEKDILGKFEEIGDKYLVPDFDDISAFHAAMAFTSDEDLSKKIAGMNETLAKAKEADKESFNWIGQLLSDDDTYSTKTQFKSFTRKANDGNDGNDGHIESPEWDLIKLYAMSGQSKIKKYKDTVQKEAKEAVKRIEKAGKKLEKEVAEIQDKNVEGGGSVHNAARIKANASKYVTAAVNVCSYQAQRSVNIMQRVVVPVMRKMHRSAIFTFISINSGVKAKNKKAVKGK